MKKLQVKRQRLRDGGLRALLAPPAGAFQPTDKQVSQASDGQTWPIPKHDSVCGVPMCPRCPRVSAVCPCLRRHRG